ncbi:MAG: hypothetical protein H6658_11780 [Ardenticatenaceae bacterium]|nr:hypothetical protein [Ardenticatenaceae bacterium]
MKKLTDLISKTIADILKPNELIFRLIERKLEERGITLTVEQKLQVRDELMRNNVTSFQIDLSEEQEKRLANSNSGRLVIDLGSQDEINDLESRIHKAINDSTQKAIVLISNSLLEGWKAQAPELLKEQSKERLDHALLIEQIWAKPLDLLEILLSVSLEAGARFNEQHRSNAAKENDFVFEAITRLHARGCQVGAEALLLLRNGFADGAHARWRTLHELSVEASFIFQNGNSVAELFLLHSQIYDYRLAEEYQKYYQVLGYAPPEQAHIDSAKKTRDRLINQYGDHFKYDYGWAAQVLKNKRPNFTHLEEFVGLKHLRPFYKLANINVHSGSMGASFRLGLPPDNNNILVAGHSIYGLSEPGQNIAFSFYLLTATLLLSRENLDQVALVSALDTLKYEIVWAFDEVMEEQEKKDV